MLLTADIWPEVAATIFGLILCVSLRIKYRDATEANAYFRQLAYTLTAATFMSVFSTVVRTFGERVPRIIFLINSTLYYVATILAAYCLLRYIVTRAERQNGRFFRVQRYLMFASLVLLALNMSTGVLFSYSVDGTVHYGPLFLPGTYGVALWFLLAACVSQGIHKDKHTLVQRIALRFAGIALMLAFIIQFFFLRELYFSYAVGIFTVYLVFFAVEMPVYRSVEEATIRLEAARRQAEEATDRALAASRAKSNFLANTSHEIRTPMNAIMGMNEMIAKGTADAHIREASGRMREAGSALLQIINDVLDYARIESGRMELMQDEYSISDVLMEIVRVWRGRIEEKGVAFGIEVADNVPDDIFGDQDKLRQIIANLISNAVKYTRYGSINVHVRKERAGDDDFLILSVEDTGVGIREEEREEIFSLFTRASIEENRNIQGAGLGLKIADELTRMMKGSIRVESVYGEGSRFILRLPFYSKEKGIAAKDALSEKMEQAKNEGTREMFRADDKSILIVDDTVVNLTVAKGLLQEMGAAADVALTGAEALSMMEKKKYDLVFLDHMMPEMDGIEVLAQLRHIKGYEKGKTDVIALTSNADETSRAFYLDSGFDDYLAKPMRSEEMNELLRKHLGGDT